MLFSDWLFAFGLLCVGWVLVVLNFVLWVSGALPSCLVLMVLVWWLLGLVLCWVGYFDDFIDLLLFRILLVDWLDDLIVVCLVVGRLDLVMFALLVLGVGGLVVCLIIWF